MSNFLKDYVDQMRLLLRVLPLLERHPDFAMKGGTAINLFFEELPRLSVDIDLVYLPLESRAESLQKIADQLQALATSLEKQSWIYRCKLEVNSENSKLYISDVSSTIKVEPNSLLRGSLFQPIVSATKPIIKEKFGLEARVNLLDEREIYAGKFNVALDRQHPRDFFDIQQYLRRSKPSDLTRVRPVFCVYLAMSGRPMHEMLDPISTPHFEETFRSKFAGMTAFDVTAAELISAFESFKASDVFRFTPGEKNFLIGVQRGEILSEDLDLSKTEREKISELPGIKWRLLNVERLRNTNEEKYLKSIELLEEALD